MTKEVVEVLSELQRESFIQDIANFLYEIHTAISVEEAQKLGVQREESSYEKEFNVVMQNIPDPKIKRFAEVTKEQYQAIKPSSEEIVFLHNDLHGENMAFDREQGKLNGVFDFGDIRIGDIHLDFYHFHKFGRPFLEAVVHAYEHISKKWLSVDRVIIYLYANQLSDLAEWINKPESEVYQKSIKRIKKWNKKGI